MTHKILGWSSIIIFLIDIGVIVWGNSTYNHPTAPIIFGLLFLSILLGGTSLYLKDKKLEVKNKENSGLEKLIWIAIVFAFIFCIGFIFVLSVSYGIHIL